MTVSQRVDDFWQELNKRPDKGTGQRLHLGQTLVPPDSKGRSRPLGPQVDHSDLHFAVPCKSVPTKVTGGTECTDLSLRNLEQRTQRPLQMLKDPAAAVRLKGLQITKVDQSASAC